MHNQLSDFKRIASLPPVCISLTYSVKAATLRGWEVEFANPIQESRAARVVVSSSLAARSSSESLSNSSDIWNYISKVRIWWLTNRHIWWEVFAPLPFLLLHSLLWSSFRGRLFQTGWSQGRSWRSCLMSLLEYFDPNIAPVITSLSKPAYWTESGWIGQQCCTHI